MYLSNAWNDGASAYENCWLIQWEENSFPNFWIRNLAEKIWSIFKSYTNSSLTYNIPLPPLFQILGIGPEHESSTPIEGEGSCPRNLFGVSRPGCTLSGERWFEIDGTGPGGGEQFGTPESVVFRCGRCPRVPSDEEWLILAVSSVRYVQRISQWVQKEEQVHTKSVRRETLNIGSKLEGVLREMNVFSANIGSGRTKPEANRPFLKSGYTKKNDAHWIEL